MAASVALATPIDKTTARAAAAAFVASDGVGAVVFRGRTVKAVFDRDGLWIVSLDPAGHVILAGSDLVDPIVGFSVNDFVEPDSESPAYAMLSASAEASRAAEVSGGVRHAKWNRLLGGGAKPRLMAAGPVDSPETIVIPPFLERGCGVCPRRSSCASFRARQRRKTLKTTGERRPQSSWRPSTGSSP